MECDIIIVPYRTLFLHIESTDNTYGIIEVLLLKKDGQVMMADPHQAPYGNSTFQICQLPVPYNPDYTPNRFYEVPGTPLDIVHPRFSGTRLTLPFIWFKSMQKGGI